MAPEEVGLAKGPKEESVAGVHAEPARVEAAEVAVARVLDWRWVGRLIPRLVATRVR